MPTALTQLLFSVSPDKHDLFVFNLLSHHFSLPSKKFRSNSPFTPVSTLHVLNINRWFFDVSSSVHHALYAPAKQPRSFP